jgi:deazaflavin-dependent oxidoreductase (nitroreductase family)
MDANTAECLKQVAGSQTLTLTHYGRKSGKPYSVLIWFMVDGDRLFLATADKRRQWVRNVLAGPDVELRIAGQSFRGKVRTVEAGDRQRVISLVQSKYWYVLPFLLTGRLLQSLGLIADNTAAFEVDLQPA